MIRSLVTAIAMTAAILACAGEAAAQGGIPRCAELPNPIFAQGTTAVVPMLRRLGAKLGTMTNKHTLVYRPKAACEAIQGQTNPQPVTTVTFETAEYYKEDPNTGKVSPLKCNVANNQVYDLAISDVFAESCPQSYLENKNLIPAGFEEFTGPVQGVVPIVSGSYSYFSDVTSRELQLIFTCGEIGRVLTFTNNTTILNYPENEGMRELVSKLWGEHGDSVKISGSGCDSSLRADATGMLTCVANSINPQETIAYTSTEVYDENRDKVKALKLRGPKQSRAYLPDSDLTSRDKINIREGRYMLQSALKLVAKVDAHGLPTSAGARKLIDWMQGNSVNDPTLQLPIDIVSIYAQSGVVPQCAMHVTKKTDDPRFKPYKPEKPCHCFFLKEATGAINPAECVACKDSTTCPGGKTCNYEYCE